MKLGGATSRVGDPTGRLKGREQVHSSIRKANMASMHMQLKKLGQALSSTADDTAMRGNLFGSARCSTIILGGTRCLSFRFYEI